MEYLALVFSDNKYEKTKAKYSKKIGLFIPLETVLDFAQHVMNVADKPENHAKGKVFDMRTGTREEVDGIYIYGNGNVSKYDEDEFGAYGTINPRKVEIEEEKPEDTTEACPF